jgi:hypothetical protein
MGVDGWRSKCDYDGEKRERREVGCWGSTSQVRLFQQCKPSPLFFSKRGRGGAGDNLSLDVKMG